MKDPFYSLMLKVARRLYLVLNPDNTILGRNWKIIPMKEYGNDLIYNLLTSDKPVMITRLGSIELKCLANYIGVRNKKGKGHVMGFVKGIDPPWWWNKNAVREMQINAGFFPPTIEKIEKFCELMIQVMPEVDILGSWLLQENLFKSELSNAKKVMLEDIEPFFAPNPWTRALKGKKILVIHPFDETIRMQYNKRNLIFNNDFLPEFELITLKAVQSIAGTETEFADWFEALDHMEKQINKIDFDICILGCGSYGFPLAAHVKRLGKKAIHLGGVTQILFGIRGKRWEEATLYPYHNLINSHWVYPGEREKPKDAKKVEEACYW